MLDKDRVRDHGGHSSKFIQAKNVKIDNDNLRILKQIKDQKSYLNFKKKEEQF